MFLAKVYISLKQTVNDPEGLTIHAAIEGLGLHTVESVRAGKYFEIRLREDDKEGADKVVTKLCDQLLSNPVIDQYRYELELVD